MFPEVMPISGIWYPSTQSFYTRTPMLWIIDGINIPAALLSGLKSWTRAKKAGRRGGGVIKVNEEKRRATLKKVNGAGHAR